MPKLRSIGFAAGVLAAAIAAAAITPGPRTEAADHLDPPTRTDPAMDRHPIARPTLPTSMPGIPTLRSSSRALSRDPRPRRCPRPMTAMSSTPSTFPMPARAPPLNSRCRSVSVRAPTARSGRAGNRASRCDRQSGRIGREQSDARWRVVPRRSVRRSLLLRSDRFPADGEHRTLAFDNRRDFFAGQNLTGFVMERPRSRIENGPPRSTSGQPPHVSGGQL